MIALLLSLSAIARPSAGETQVVVVMKTASCGVCATQVRELANADLGVSLIGITHNDAEAASRATNATGVRVYSHPPGIRAMGLLRHDLGISQPAVVVYDKCGDEVGRIVGRQPGVDVTRDVRDLVKSASSVQACGKPQS